MSNLITSLNTLGRKVNQKFPNVNFGGCCVYAAYLGLLLESKGWSVRGRVSKPCYAPEGVNLRTAASNLKNPIDHYEWGDNGVYFYHVFLMIDHEQGSFFHDTDSTEERKVNFNGMPYYDGYLTTEELKMLADEPEGWNTVFNRRNISPLLDIIRDHGQFIPEAQKTKFTIDDLRNRFKRYA